VSPVIIAVDDNEIHAYALRKMLEKHGYTVIEAHSGEEAVEFTKQHRPDLILLDVNLPDFNGFEVCRRVRAMHTFLPAVVFHTAVSANQATRAQAMAAGATAFLTYPVATEQLLMVINASIKRSRQAAAGTESSSTH
jgi:CheY-like chemotaxis protein